MQTSGLLAIRPRFPPSKEPYLVAIRRAQTTTLSHPDMLAPDLAEWNRWLEYCRSLAQIGANSRSSPEPGSAGLSPQAIDLIQRYSLLAKELIDGYLSGAAPTSTGATQAADRRFSGREWREYPYFDFLKQSYLLYSEFCREWVDLLPSEPDEKERAHFWVERMIDSVSPSNFLASNPEALREAIASEGESVKRGFENLLRDAARRRISMSDENAFTVGDNLAITPGKVVFRNELIEIIQYAALTTKVYYRPLLIVPPCINKYYILDLRPQNSFVRYAVESGHTVFMVSWRNVPAELGHLTWDDYVERGVMTAIEVVKAVRRTRRINALGFCVGGTLLASALAVLAARRDRSVASLTLLTTMLDFSEPGEISAYLDPASLDIRTTALASGARIHGSELSSAFASLRANELIWSFVVNNYLKGRTPPPFDLLYWNGDSANLAGPMYLYLLREMYFRNRLRVPGELTMCGTPVSLKEITMPTYVLATRDDHIVPWRSAFQTTKLLGGQKRFVLGASGHIAGVINPASKKHRNYWVNSTVAELPDEWLANAVAHPGSWWNDWRDWLAPKGGRMKIAKGNLGNANFQPLEDAPGSYVLAKA